jgi:signal transduction histidine kinase
VDIEDDVLDDVQFDKQRLSQILVNLLSNAVKFTFEGFIKVKIQRVNNAISGEAPDEEILSNNDLQGQRRHSLF